MNWLDKHYYHKAARVMPVITATLVMMIVGSLGYLGHRTLSKLETIQNEELHQLSLLTQISSDIAQNHLYIYEHLRSAQDAVDEGAFYDKGKPLLLKMHVYEKRLQAYIKNHSKDLETTSSLKFLLEKLVNYRNNIANAIIMSSVNLELGDDLLKESTEFYVQLNKQGLEINQIIQGKLKRKAVQYHEKFTYTSLVAIFFVACLIIVSIFISRLLSRRFQEKLLMLESLFSPDRGHRESTVKVTNEISILSSAITNIENNYKFLENARQQQIEQNKLLEAQMAITQKKTMELNKVNEELKNFAYIVSHDLKAPLRAIYQLSGWIETDYAAAFDDDGREQMTLLRSRAKRMHEMIDGILEFSRIGRVKVIYEKVDLNDFFSDVVDTVGLPKHIKLDIQANLPVVLVDKVRFFQVLQNLLDNAIKYNNKAEGLIKFNYEEHEHEWSFVMQDNGIGIDKTHQQRVFGLFQTIAERDKDSGTGVGLSLIEKSVTSWDGKIFLESELGKGSKFTFTLPKERVINE